MDYALQAGYSPRAVRRTLTEHLKFLRYCVLLFKHNGTIGTLRPDYRDGLIRLWRVYGPHPFAWGVVAPMMLMPAPLFRGLHRAYRGIKGAVRPGRPKRESRWGIMARDAPAAFLLSSDV